MPRLPRIIDASRLALALEGHQRALDLLVVLELDLEQPDELDGQSGGARDADEAVLVGREDLLHVAVGDEVAHGRATVAGHDHASGIRQRDVVVPCGASTAAPGGSERPDGSRVGAWVERNSVKDEDPGTR